MKKTLLFAALLAGSVAANAQNPKYSWVHQYTGTDVQVANATAVDPAGNVYTTGNFKGTSTIGGVTFANLGANDIFITKYSNSGTYVWAKRIGGISDDLVRGICADKDGNVYVTGNYNQNCSFDGSVFLTSAGLGDIFVAKYDSLGNLSWAKSMGGTGADLGFGIAVDNDGNVYSTGSFSGTVDFDPGAGISNLAAVGSSDIYISKLDKDGNYEWAKSIGDRSPEGGVGIGVDNDGNVIAGGSFQGTVDFDPAPAIRYFTSLGDNDIFILKLNSMGLFQWAKQIGGTGGEYLEHMSLDKWGNVLYTANYSSGADFDPGTATFNLTGSGKIVVSKLNNNGNFVWAKKLGSLNSQERSKAVQADPFGNVFTVGEFDGTQDFDPGAGSKNVTAINNTDIFLSKLDSNGNYSGFYTAGGAYTDQGNGLAIDKMGNVFASGGFNDTVGFNPSAPTVRLLSGGNLDAFVVKLTQCFINKATTTSGNTITSATSGASYQWVSCPAYTDITGANAQSYTPANSGSYAVIIISGVGCRDTSACVSVIGTGISESALTSNISIHPNPATNVVNISNLASGQSINIINTLGVSVFQSKATNSTMTIDVNAFATGMYFVQIAQEGQIITTKKLLISK